MWPVRAMRDPNPLGAGEEERVGVLRRPSPPGSLEMRKRRAEILREMEQRGQGRRYERVGVHPRFVL